MTKLASYNLIKNLFFFESKCRTRRQLKALLVFSVRSIYKQLQRVKAQGDSLRETATSAPGIDLKLLSQI